MLKIVDLRKVISVCIMKLSNKQWLIKNTRCVTFNLKVYSLNFRLNIKLKDTIYNINGLPVTINHVV